MIIYRVGINFSTGERLLEPLDDRQFGESILESLSTNAEQVRQLTRGTSTGSTFRKGVESQVPMPSWRPFGGCQI